MKGIFVASACLVSLAMAAEPPACSGEALRECAAARTALIQAESAVREAARLKALWTTAQNALLEAQAAFSHANYDKAVRAAADAEELARLGIAQTRYPPFTAPKP
jgi:hypothetical protein